MNRQYFVTVKNQGVLTSPSHGIKRVVPGLPLKQLVDHTGSSEEHHHSHRYADVQRYVAVSCHWKQIQYLVYGKLDSFAFLLVVVNYRKNVSYLKHI